MKFIRFTLSKGEPFILPFEQAKQVFTSTEQIVLLKAENGEWSGQTINKAHIVCTDRDIETERSWRDKNIKQLQEPPVPIEKQQKINHIKKEIAQKLKIK